MVLCVLKNHIVARWTVISVLCGLTVACGIPEHSSQDFKYAAQSDLVAQSTVIRQIIPEDTNTLKRAMAVQTSTAIDSLNVLRLYQALYGLAPSVADYGDWLKRLKTSDESSFTKTAVTSWTATPNATLAQVVLSNLSVSEGVVGKELYKQILSILTQIFLETPRDLRGQVILNVARLLSNLESDVYWGKAATAFNKQVARNAEYVNSGLSNGQELSAKFISEFHDLGGVLTFSTDLPSLGKTLDLNAIRQCPKPRDYGGVLYTAPCDLENAQFASSDGKFSAIVDFKDFPELPTNSLRTSISIIVQVTEEVLIRVNKSVDRLTGKTISTPIYGSQITQFVTHPCSILTSNSASDPSNCSAQSVTFDRTTGEVILNNTPISGSRWTTSGNLPLSPNSATVTGRLYVQNEVQKYGGADAANYRAGTLSLVNDKSVTLSKCASPELKVTVGPCFEQYKAVELSDNCHDTSTPLAYDRWMYDNSARRAELYQCLATNSLGGFQDLYLGKLREAQSQMIAATEMIKRDTVCPPGYTSGGNTGGLICHGPSGEVCTVGNCKGNTAKQAYDQTLATLNEEKARAAALVCKQEAANDGWADDLQYDSFCRLAAFDACLHRAGYDQYDSEGRSVCVILDDLVKSTGVKPACRTCNPKYPY